MNGETARINEEKLRCACLNVVYDPIHNDDGTNTDRWVCSYCDSEFYRKTKSAPGVKIDNTELRVRRYISFTHNGGTCPVYGDDGELTCNNLRRHNGKIIDFMRMSIEEILDIIDETAQREAMLHIRDSGEDNCEDFEMGVNDGDCEGDGHYMCLKCKHKCAVV